MAIKTEDEFNSYFEEVLSAKMEEVESLRKAYRARRSSYSTVEVLAVIIFSVILIIGYPTDNQYAVCFFMGPAIILTLAIGSTLIQQNYANYKLKFEQMIVEAIVKFYGEGFNYVPEAGIFDRDIALSKLYPVDNYVIGDNYVEGYIGDTYIQFSKVEAMKFKGIFLIASFNKYFNGEYLVFSKTSFQRIDKALHDFTRYRETHLADMFVTLENPEFEKEFDVYASDQVEARYILSPSLMSRMMDFKNKIGTVHFSFTHSKMFIAIQVPKVDLFEPPTRKPLSEEKIHEWNKYLFYAFNTVEEFNLNTHIWSKP